MNESEHRPDVSWKVEYLMVLTLFLYIGMEYDYAGWISSYATISGFSTKEQATVFPMIFWVVMTGARFGCSMVRGPSSRKLGTTIKATAIFGVLSLGLISLNLP